jgi:hypothetical protein
MNGEQITATNSITSQGAAVATPSSRDHSGGGDRRAGQSAGATLPAHRPLGMVVLIGLMVVYGFASRRLDRRVFALAGA